MREALFQAGMIGRALDLAFRTQQFSALDLLAKELGTHTDPSTLTRAAEFFANNNNYERAVELLCYAKDVSGFSLTCSIVSLELLAFKRISMPNHLPMV